LPASHLDAGDVDKLEERILHILLYCTVLYTRLPIRSAKPLI
jgi:hypothetical protein